MMETVGQSNANPVYPTESEVLRVAITEDVKEIQERQKRKSSIVVKRARKCFMVQSLKMFGSIFHVQIKFCNCPILFVLAGTRNFTGPRLSMLRLGDFKSVTSED